MALDFRYRRQVTIAGLPDADPNTAQPASGDIFVLQERPPSGQLWTTGMLLYGEFAGGAPGPNASFDFVVWVRDARVSNLWSFIPQVKKHKNLQLFPTDEVRNADVFVQVLGVSNAGAATSLILHAVEQ